jgi:hypothetical protein
MAMKYLSAPLKATGWENTLVNDSEGNTILLMPNGHKGLEAAQEAAALFAAAPDMLAALERIVEAELNGGSAIGMRLIASGAIKAAKGDI